MSISKTKSLSVVLADDQIQGDMIAVVSVDGHMAYRGTVIGDAATGGTRISLGNWASDVDHKVTVQFINDADNTPADAARNFYVKALLVDGVPTGDGATLLKAGTLSFAVPAGYGAAPVHIGGTGPDTVVLTMSEDAYLGDAQFYVTVDGVQVGGLQTARALHGAGQGQAFTFKATLGTDQHKIGVTFVNDSYGGSADTDRNLYVNALTINGVDQGKSASIFSAVHYDLAVGIPAETVIGTGSQTLSIRVSEDAYQGDATFDVTVDGHAVATGLTAQAMHAGGGSQLYTIKGEFGAGSHTVGVTFTNDAYGGPMLDRNLFVESIAFDGTEALPSEAPLLSAATASVSGAFAIPRTAPTTAPSSATTPPMSNSGPGTTSTGTVGTTGTGTAATETAPTGTATTSATPASTTPATPVPSARYGATADVGLTAITAPSIPAGTNTLTVGVGKQFSTIAAAIGASRDGDVILVDGGTYTNDFANVYSKISLIAVGGRVTMNATVDTPNQKGILVAETDLTVVGFTFTGAHITDDLGHNAAGIRVDNGNIVLINDEFTHNQNGILTNAGQGISITIDHSVFDHNGGNDGNGAGNIHNIYVGDVKSFRMTNSISKAAQVGHELKSRAETNFIDNNLIVSGVDGGSGSYGIDLPNGGKSTVTNNTIIKGPGAENHTMVHFGGEGIPYAGSSLTVSGNLFTNTADGATGVLNQTSITAKISNNQLNGLSYGSFVGGPATISSTFDDKGVAYADSVLTGVLPGSTIIYDENDKAAHAVTLDGNSAMQAVQGGGGRLSVAIVTGHIVVIGGSGGLDAIESATSGTGGNQITTMAGSTNTMVLYGQDSLDSEGTDTITTHDGNVGGQLNGTATVVQAGRGDISWGVNGTSTIQTGTGSTFISLGAAAMLTLTGSNQFYKVDSNGGTLRMDNVNGGLAVSGTVTGSYTMQTYGGMVRMVTAGGSSGVVMTMGAGDVQFVSKGADEFHAGSGNTTVQVAGNARIYAGTGALDFYGYGSSGADFYGNGGTYYLGGDTGNITYHGGDLASTLNNGLGRGTILGGAGRLTINFSARDRIVGGAGGIVLNQNGGGADTISTAAGSVNTLNLTVGNEVTSNGNDTINWAPANGFLTLNGSSALTVQDGVVDITVAGRTNAVVLAGHDTFKLLAGSTSTLDLHGYHSVHGESASLAMHFTNDQGSSGDLGWSGGILDAWTDTNGAIHAFTSGSGVSNVTSSGNLVLQTMNAAHVVLGAGTSRVDVSASQAEIIAGAGTTAINGGWGGSFSVTGGSGTVTADSGWMDMTFIGGSGTAALSGGSIAIVGGSGAITATGNGVKSFLGGTGRADLSLAGGARVTLGAGASHFTEKAWGSADLFTLTAASVGNAVIDGFQTGLDKIALTGPVKLTSQSVAGGAAHLVFNTGATVTLTGVTDLRTVFA